MDHIFLLCFRLYLIKRMVLMLIDGIIFFEMVVSSISVFHLTMVAYCSSAV